MKRCVVEAGEAATEKAAGQMQTIQVTLGAQERGPWTGVGERWSPSRCKGGRRAAERVGNGLQNLTV
ncbi:hypothetical protein GGTG_09401 [Gaeumannomyces tritici R3-111a-1]|uniref:Uncharacterized protein n=1 Tax=Gaeumannomyces tritici (strain R3-111a-1) TaxID=644352 RepID=J3P7A5_GAET3|nr:hypothetical protein GGTG_09401 [Gaeumannomyces tritici R3-111a-1]EJT72536.1 hypothetical protein GGTG_09401 [Gaeumannomyces tritici R3-111a-1]